MTEITISLELLLTGIAGLLGFAIGGTWKVVNAINAGRSALKAEVKEELNEIWQALKTVEDKWDRKADVVHKRIGDAGKSASETSTELAKISGLIAGLTGNKNGQTATKRR